MTVAPPEAPGSTPSADTETPVTRPLIADGGAALSCGYITALPLSRVNTARVCVHGGRLSEEEAVQLSNIREPYGPDVLMF